MPNLEWAIWADNTLAKEKEALGTHALLPLYRRKLFRARGHAVLRHASDSCVAMRTENQKASVYDILLSP